VYNRQAPEVLNGEALPLHDLASGCNGWLSMCRWIRQPGYIRKILRMFSCQGNNAKPRRDCFDDGTRYTRSNIIMDDIRRLIQIERMDKRRLWIKSNSTVYELRLASMWQGERGSESRGQVSDRGRGVQNTRKYCGRHNWTNPKFTLFQHFLGTQSFVIFEVTVVWKSNQDYSDLWA
jgi:hypothetical protein